MKKIYLLWATVSVVILSGLALAGVFYHHVKGRLLGTAETTYLYITPDDTQQWVEEQIENETVRRGFHWLANHNHYGEHMKTGRYALLPTDNALTIYRRLSRGQQTPINLVVPSVRTVEQLGGRLAKQLMIDSLQIVNALRDSVYLVLPNTYEVYWNISAEALQQRVATEYRRYWNEARRTLAEEMGLTPLEVATLASIVEEETANDAEKPIVAGLYINRLKRGMLLQADPTVKYAVGDFTLRRILYAHLEVDSPYNTYKYAGLPPSPIRIPSITGLESVLHYAHHNYLYMCAKEDFSGTHNFTHSLSQHNANAARYQAALNRRKIR